MAKPTYEALEQEVARLRVELNKSHEYGDSCSMAWMDAFDKAEQERNEARRLAIYYKRESIHWQQWYAYLKQRLSADSRTSWRSMLPFDDPDSIPF